MLSIQDTTVMENTEHKLQQMIDQLLNEKKFKENELKKNESPTKRAPLRLLMIAIERTDGRAENNEKLRAEIKEIDSKVERLKAEIEIARLKAEQHEKAMQLHLHSKAKKDGSNEGMAPLPKGQVNAVLRYV